MKLKNLMHCGLLLSLSAAWLCSSCSNENLPALSQLPEPKTHTISVAQAETNVLNFVSNLNLQTRSGSSANLRIAGTQVVCSQPTGTRGNDKATSPDTLFYVVNFQDSCGFALAASDDRETPIYAYVEQGNYTYDQNDTTQNGFNAFVSALAELRAYFLGNNDDKEAGSPDHFEPDGDRRDGGDGGPIGKPDKFEVLRPLLVTRWGQTPPYNKYCNGCLTGCVITAVSQICSYLQTPNHIQYNFNGEVGSTDLDWEAINNECKNNWGEPTNMTPCADQIARLMRF